MNSNSRNQRVLQPVVWTLGPNCVPRLSRWIAVQRMTLIFGLVIFGLNGRGFAQSPAPSFPIEWTSLVDPTYSNAPANSLLLDQDTTFNHSTPLANLRQADPSGLIDEDLPTEQVVGNTNYSNRQNRSEQTLAVGWDQPELRHRRLYFEDQQIERGNAQRQFPNVTAGANFFKSLFAFPLRLATGK